MLSPSCGAEQRFALVQNQQTSILHAYFTADSHTLGECRVRRKERQSLSTALDVQAVYMTALISRFPVTQINTVLFAAHQLTCWLILSLSFKVCLQTESGILFLVILVAAHYSESEDYAVTANRFTDVFQYQLHGCNSSKQQ